MPKIFITNQVPPKNHFYSTPEQYESCHSLNQRRFHLCMCNLSLFQKEQWYLLCNSSRDLYYLVAKVAQCMQPLYWKAYVTILCLCKSCGPIDLHAHSGIVAVGVHWGYHSQVIEMSWAVIVSDITNFLARPHSYSKCAENRLIVWRRVPFLRKFSTWGRQLSFSQ